MNKNGRSKILLLALAAMLSVLCAACGSKGGDLNVTITDGYCSTVLTAGAGETVASVLSRAEITLTEEDTSVPGADETITEDNTTITISRNAQVNVSDGDVAVSLSMTGATVADAISEAGITLGEYDVVNHAAAAYLTDGMEIEIEHWYEVTIKAGGEEQIVITQAGTVEELLAEQGITLTDEDRVMPAPETVVDTDGVEIEVQYVSTREIVEETVIAYETVYEDSDTLYIGETEVAQEGQDGIEETTYTVTYVDGEEESRVVSKRVVTQEATDEIILVGTKEKVEEPSEQESQSGSNTGTNAGSGTGAETGTNAGSESSSESDDVSEDGRKIVSKQAVYDCDGSGYGYYIIEYEDGSVEYEDFYDPDFW